MIRDSFQRKLVPGGHLQEAHPVKNGEIWTIAPSTAPSYPLFVLGTALLGACKGSLDVSINAQAVGVESAYGRPIMSSFQAAWSVGGLVGAALAGAALRSGLVAEENLAAAGAFILAIAFLSVPYLIRERAAGQTMEPSRQNLLLARWAVALAFFLHGVTTGSWAPHIPLLQQKLGLPTNTLGMALFVVPLGAVASLSVASYLISRYGSSLITRVALIPLCLSVYFATAAPSLPALVLGALSYGFLRGILDISMNTHGLLIENKLKKHIVASLHGCWSIGLLSGGALATTLFRVASPDIHRMVEPLFKPLSCFACYAIPFVR